VEDKGVITCPKKELYIRKERYVTQGIYILFQKKNTKLK